MNNNANEVIYVKLTSIGIIHSHHKEQNKTPIQPVYAQGIKGQVEIFTEYLDGLRDLNGFSHINLLYYFHKAVSGKLMVKPFLDDSIRGVFSTRAPSRPNRIGMSVVKLIKIDKNILHIENVDILDGTPLLDIKPYVSRFEINENVKCGWQDTIEEQKAQIIGTRQMK